MKDDISPKKQVIKDWKLKNDFEELTDLVGEAKSENSQSFIRNENRKSILIGGGDNCIKADYRYGLWIGDEVFNNAPFSVSIDGQINATKININSFVANTDSSIAYTGTWTQSGKTVAYGGTTAYSNSVGDYFEITFYGTTISLSMSRGRNAGKLTIYIDGVSQGTLDLYSAYLIERSTVYNKTGLTNESHVLKGVVATKNVSATDNYVYLNGYSLFGNEGLQMEAISNDLITYSKTVTTNAYGYATDNISGFTGYSTWSIVGIKLSTQRLEHKLGDATSRWDVTNPAGTTFRYTWDGAGTTPIFTRITAATTQAVISGGFAAGNQGTFTIDAIGADYFEVTNAGGAVESNITGATIYLTGLKEAKICWAQLGFYVYDGYPNESYTLTITQMISKV